MPSAREALAGMEAERRGLTQARVRFWLAAACVVSFYVVAGRLVHFDLGRLADGLPKIGRWLATAWPLDFAEIPLFLWRTAETVAMAAIGTSLAILVGLPLSILASRNVTPFPRLHRPTRWLLNALRGIDSFVFALLFVAAVGLGPFAGVLGIAFHTTGTVAKLFSDQIESANLGPYEAVRATGAARVPALLYALLPDLLPLMLSTGLFWWEFNVRASTVLGVVGAGGIGQELKNSMDLLDFSRLFTIVAIILVVVTALDWVSGRLRKRWFDDARARNDRRSHRERGPRPRPERLRAVQAFWRSPRAHGRQFHPRSSGVCGGARAQRRRKVDAFPMHRRPRKLRFRRVAFRKQGSAQNPADRPSAHRRRLPAIQSRKAFDGARKRARRQARPRSLVARRAAPVRTLGQAQGARMPGKGRIAGIRPTAGRHAIGGPTTARRHSARAGAGASTDHRGRTGRQPGSHVGRGVLQLLKDIAKTEGVAVLTSLHQLAYARAYADRIIGMSGGKIVLDSRTGDLDEAALANLYQSASRPSGIAEDPADGLGDVSLRAQGAQHGADFFAHARP